MSIWQNREDRFTPRQTQLLSTILKNRLEIKPLLSEGAAPKPEQQLSHGNSHFSTQELTTNVEGAQGSQNTIEQNAPSYDYIGPSQRLYSREEWKSWLNQPEVIEGNNNIDNAARLMEIHTQVMDEVTQQIIAEGLKNFTPPDTHILINEKKADGALACTDDGRSVLIKKSVLEQISQIEPEGADSITAKNRKGDVLFEGTPADFIRLATVEETDHADFDQNPPATILIPAEKEDPQSLTLAEYDATDIESRALERQLSYAQQHSMSQHIISHLQARISLKNLIRAQKRGSTTPS